MNWKGFLKPTKGRIVIFAALFLLLLITWGGPHNKNNPFQDQIQQILSFPAYEANLIGISFNGSSGVILFAILLLYWYILSCLVITLLGVIRMWSMKKIIWVIIVLTLILASAFYIKTTLDNLPFATGRQSVTFDFSPVPKCENGYLTLHISNSGFKKPESPSNELTPSEISIFTINGWNYLREINNFEPLELGESGLLLNLSCEGTCTGKYHIELETFWRRYSNYYDLECP